MRHATSLNRTARVAGVILALTVFGAACGSSQQVQKEDDKQEKVVEKSRMEKLSERTGMEQKALEKFEEAVAEQQKDKPDSKKVENLLVEVVEAEPKFAEGHYNLGVLYSDLGKSDEAVSHLERAHDLAPEKLDYTVALAQAYASDEKFSQARDLFKEVVSRQPNNLTAKNNLAVMSLRQGDGDEALEHVRDVLREDNQNVGALNVLGLIYRKRNNPSLAKYAFQKALEYEESNADIHNNLGLVYLKENDLPSAVNAFAAAIEADPNYLESRLNVGAIFLDYLDYDRAFKQFEEAVRIAPNHCTARLGKGAAAFAKDKAEMAAKNYKYYVDECDAEHVSSWERLAELHESKLDDNKRAITIYGKLLDLCEKKEKCAEYRAQKRFLENQRGSEGQKSPKEGDGAAEEAGESAEGDQESGDGGSGGGESDSEKGPSDGSGSGAQSDPPEKDPGAGSDGSEE